jgi:hypothetical protein
MGRGASRPVTDKPTRKATTDHPSHPGIANAASIGALAAERARIETAGFARVKSTYRVFFPRWLAWLPPLEDRLGFMPAGAQYHTVGVKA